MHRATVLLALVGVAAGNFYCSSTTNAYFCTTNHDGTISQIYDCTENTVINCAADKICAPGETVKTACITRDDNLICPLVQQFQISAIADKGLHYICIGEEATPILSKCETGFKFVRDDPNRVPGSSGSCKVQATTTNPITTPCTAANKNEKVVHPTSCGHYYMCNGSTWTAYTCMGYFFSSATKTCVAEISVCNKP
ncbi:hypothetical protein B566_EDAN004627 [Ephemera danica]|nr:hypothetical protein B566_EDAN004627 [Ephemera danica]